MSDDAPQDQSALLRALSRVLRPLIRVFVRRGLTLPTVYRALKVIYVEVAEQEFRIDDKPVTDSRVSLLTGVHRRDVRRLREETPDMSAEGRPNLLATVLGRWLSAPETLDAEGRPLPLPRTSEVGPSFDALVQSLSQDMRPRTVLDEMLAQGLVELDPEGRVILAPGGLAGARDMAQKLHFFAQNVGDHMAAAADNIETEDPPYLERAVFYNRLSPASVAYLDGLARQMGQEMLLALNREARARQAKDAEKEDATHRFRAGIYVYEEDESDGPTG